MIGLTYVLSILVLAAGALSIARRTGTALNPYTLIALGFGIEVVLIAADPFFSRPVPGAYPSNTLGFVFLGAMISSVGGLLLGLRGKSTNGVGPRFRIAGVGVITLSCSLVALLTLAHLYRSAGGFPLLIMGKKFEAGIGAYYTDYLSSIFMYGLGFCRIPSMVLAVDYVGSGMSFRDHVRAHLLWYGITLATTGLMVLGGQRNCFFWPCACWLGAYFLVGTRSVRSILPPLLVGVLLLWLFSFVGSIRLGSSSGTNFVLFSYFKFEIPDNSITRALVWIPAYLGPSLYNLNAALLSAYEPTMGRTLLMKTLPDQWLPSSFSGMELMVHHLDVEGLMPMAGQTFRTAMADFYGEFGVAGAILGPGLFLWLSARGYRDARRSALWCYLYFTTLPGVLLLPLLDFFTGASNLIPGLFCFIMPFLLQNYSVKRGFHSSAEAGNSGAGVRLAP